MKKFLTLSTLLALPALVAAQSQTADLTYFTNLFSSGTSLLRALVNVFMVVAFIYFLITVFQFIRAEGDKKAEFRSKMLWALLGLFIMTSVWGIIGLARRTANVGQGGGGALTCPPGTTPMRDTNPLSPSYNMMSCI